MRKVRLDKHRRVKVVQAAVILLRTCGAQVSVRNVLTLIKLARGKAFRYDEVRVILIENDKFMKPTAAAIET